MSSTVFSTLMGSQPKVFFAFELSIWFCFGFGVPGFPFCAFGNASRRAEGAFSKKMSSNGWYDESAFLGLRKQLHQRP